MFKEELQSAYQETQMLDTEWDKTDWMDKPVILAGSLAIGVGDAIHDFALSIVHLLQDIQKTLNNTGNWLGRYTSYHEQLHRAWDKGDIDIIIIKGCAAEQGRYFQRVKIPFRQGRPTTG